MILVLMGVCGCGKSTIGNMLAKKLSWDFVDADDLHSHRNKEKMSKGIPLTDQDRYPWLMKLHHAVMQRSSHGGNLILACSALKRTYRHIIEHGRTEVTPWPGSTGQSKDAKLHQVESTGGSSKDSVVVNLDHPARCHQDARWIGGGATNHRIIWVHLKGSLSVLDSRMRSRQNHFMPKGLLKSQLETLEELADDEDHLIVDIDRSVEDIVQATVTAVSQSLQSKL